MLYTAICYIPYALLLFFTVLIFPALALFPSLTRTPLLTTAIPIISILIVNTIALLLLKLGIYHHTEVIMMTTCLSLLACIRTFFYLRDDTPQWDKSDKYIILLNLGILLPLLAFNGISTFMTNDALASWNYWGLNYYWNETPDMGGYPPFFSIFISYCYHVLGNTDYQGPVKALLTVFPFIIMNAIAFTSTRTSKHILAYLILISVCVFPGLLNYSFYRFYSVGYADPMLAASIAASFMLFLKYFNYPDEKQTLWFATLCGITASLTKQPGLILACVSMPLIMITRMLYLKKFNLQEWLAVAVLFIPPLTWLLGAGSHFYQNSGVLTTSLHHEHFTLYDIVNTLNYSINRYLINQPAILALLILAGVASIQQKYKALLFFLFVIPSLILWFIFGSYEIRLGLHILAAAGLLIASANYFESSTITRWSSHKLAISMQITAIVLFTLGTISFAIFSFTDQKNPHINVPNKIFPLNAGLSNIYRYFDNQAEFIYKNIYNNSTISIWAPHRIIAGIFYGHTKIIPAPTSYDANAIYENLKTYQPEYVIAAFCNRIMFDCDGIKHFMQLHPGVLTNIPMAKAQYDHRLYRVNKEQLEIIS